MKRLLPPAALAFAALVLAALAAPQALGAPQTDLQRAELKGPVASVVTRLQEKGDDEAEFASEADYDRAGMLTERKENKVDFIADEKPERHGPNMTIFRSGMGDSVELYKFDAAGNVIETDTYYGLKTEGAPNTVTRFKRDARGLVIEQDFLDGSGKPLSTIYFKRDAAGNIVSDEQAIGADAKPPLPHTAFAYVFDSHGNWIRRTERRSRFPKDDYFYGPQGTLTRTITYYDAAPAKK